MIDDLPFFSSFHFPLSTPTEFACWSLLGRMAVHYCASLLPHSNITSPLYNPLSSLFCATTVSSPRLVTLWTSNIPRFLSLIMDIAPWSATLWLRRMLIIRYCTSWTSVTRSVWVWLAHSVSSFAAPRTSMQCAQPLLPGRKKPEENHTHKYYTLGKKILRILWWLWFRCSFHHSGRNECAMNKVWMYDAYTSC